MTSRWWGVKHAAARFTGVMVVVLACLLGLQVAGLVSQHRVEEATDRRLELTADVAQIRYYDQVLTASALLAASTGAPTWVERYDAGAPQLDAAIGRALSLSDDPAAAAALGRVDEANRILLGLENSAFRRIAAGDGPGALEILQGERYTMYKTEYAGGMETTSRLLLADAGSASASAERRGRLLLVAGLVAGAALVALWLVLTRSLAGSQRARAAVEGRLRALADADPLTGLANRRLLSRHLEAALGGAGTTGLLFVDLDGFKAVNDELGHGAGDAVLVESARRLEAVGAAHGAALVARLGGDEFAVLLAGTDEVAARGAARAVVAALEAPHDPPVERTVGASVGVAVAPGGTDPEGLLRGADAHMYAVKRSRRGAPAGAGLPGTRPCAAAPEPAVPAEAPAR